MEVIPRVKFRCVHCGRLLSAPANRIGKAIACPKCVQAVTIPTLGAGSEREASQPESPSQAAAGAAVLRSTASQKARDDLPEFMAGIAAAIPDEVLAIQPEDIRAEVPLLGIDLAPVDRVDLPLEISQSEEWSPPADPDMPPGPDPNPRDTVRAESWFNPPATASSREAAAEATLPPIEVEAVPLRSTASEPTIRRTGDVTLPASVVLAWSLFVLFAQAFAFLAGLLIGHFYWKHL
jgi:hypothetical protein